ncbi:tetratricopeptide repeat protein [Nannocystis sp. ILAH1]|uniref:tetratricopeptide repeat protein n=1 Tax=unclassified Nannocystis TaxID=2627009 RepID=UPI002270E1EF|nr:MULTISPECIES: tetratricopeptide repeat protein [unclassified Nannocystis]MCY0990368.1 tetratricopeptide repeat protein [Nannocystis sp. ILAH1]MCY1069343.1 tetratricopeptide repeat protein [Nannocystis sp. RBIL2]
MSEERRRVLNNLDRIEDRLRDAPEGLHDAGEPADEQALAASGLDPDVALLWGTYDGIDLGGGEARVYPLAEHAEATEAAAADGRLRPGDRVIGERGRDLLVLAADPHAEGADVVLVEEDGERLPCASSVDRMVLALLGEFSVLFDEDGEYQADLFGDDGELSPAAERRILRRHLDLDPDAPLARFRLAQSLRRAGELRGAAQELRQLLRRAPDFVWGHLELGRVRLGDGKPGDAVAAFRKAAELAAEPGLRAHCLALACLALSGMSEKPGSSAQVPKAMSDKTGPSAQEAKASAERAALAAAALAANPMFAAAQEAAVRDALEREDAAAADEQLTLGLAVVPGHLGLLALRPALAELKARPADSEDDELADEDDPDADMDPALLDDDAERVAAHARPEPPAKADPAPGTGSASSPYGGRKPAKSSDGRRSRRPARSRG